MAMGRQGPRQAELLLGWEDLPRSPGQVFWDRLGEVLKDAGFAAFVEAQGQPFYAPVMGARPLPPGHDVRMHLIGYFEGSSSARGIEWRCADSLSLRAFFGAGGHGAGAGPRVAEPDAGAAAAGGPRRRSSPGCWSVWPSAA
jgi:hypothetical protein